jgi:hypothetical protein
VGVDEIAEVVWQLLTGEKNGAIAELVGGKGLLPPEKTVIWR